jgi:hypothetical protein
MQIRLPIVVTRLPGANYYLESPDRIRTTLVALLL